MIDEKTRNARKYEKEAIAENERLSKEIVEHLATIKRMNEINQTLGKQAKDLELDLKLANEIIDRLNDLSVEKFEQAMKRNS